MSAGQKLEARHIEHPMQAVHGDQVEHVKTDEEFRHELCVEIAKRKDKLRDEGVDLAIRVLEAQETMEWAVNHLSKTWVDWDCGADQRLKDLRLQRMIFDGEVKQLLAAARDVREFFLDNKHDEEVRRLKEFVELCERLEGLKKRGVLDAVTDVILKIAET